MRRIKSFPPWENAARVRALASRASDEGSYNDRGYDIKRTLVAGEVSLNGNPDGLRIPMLFGVVSQKISLSKKKDGSPYDFRLFFRRGTAYLQFFTALVALVEFFLEVDLQFLVVVAIFRTPL